MSRRNPVKGETPLVLSDGREFTLVADHAALAKAAQQYTGTTKFRKLFADMQPLLGADGTPLLDEDGDPVKDTLPATAALLFGLLDAHHPGVTMREAWNMLMSDSDAVGEAIGEAVRLGFPDAEPGSAEGNAKAPPRRGKSSGRSGAKRG